MIREKLAASVNMRAREKFAGYTPDSLSSIIESAKSGKDLESAIDAKIEAARSSGKLVDNGGFFSNLMGPHTATAGFAPLALLSKAVNSIRPGTMDYKLSPTVNMAGMTGEEMIESLANLSPEYLDKVSPGIADKFYKAVAAHELLEAEAMQDHIPGITNVIGGAQTGGLLGLLTSAIAMGVAYKNRKKGKETGLISHILANPVLPTAAGMLAGVGLGNLYNYVTGQPAMDNIWSSHMSADIPRLESIMVNKLNDPALTEIFKAMRTRTGERRAIQEGAMQDYGENIAMDKLKAIQSTDPMKYFLDMD